MTAQPPSWAVAALVDLPAPLLAAMALHHLDQGAACVELFLDRPDPALRALLASFPAVRLTDCDAAFWAARGIPRPAQAFARQIVVANLAYARCPADWLFHLDGDEFVDCGATLAADLAAVPAGRDVVRLHNVERVLPRWRPQRDLFEGLFRRPRRRSRWLAPLIWGHWAGFLQGGLAGYCIGKAGTRTGMGHIVKIHGAQAGPDSRRPVQWAELRRSRVLHFDAVTRLHWRMKLLGAAQEAAQSAGAVRRAPGKTRQMAMMLRPGADAATAARLTEALVTAGRWQALLLRLCGLAWRPRCDPGAAARRLLPGLDLSPAAFDAALAARPQQDNATPPPVSPA